MKIKDFLENFSEESERIANDIFEYMAFLSHKNRKYKTMREEHIPLRAYIKKSNVAQDSDIELGGEQHDFDAKITFVKDGKKFIKIVEIVQAIPEGEYRVRNALVNGKMNESMRQEELTQLNCFPQPIIDAINKKHSKMYADRRVLLVSVIGEHTFEDDNLILSWLPVVKSQTEIGLFSEIYLVETARSVIFKIH